MTWHDMKKKQNKSVERQVGDLKSKLMTKNKKSA